MTFRLVVAITAISLLAAACGGDSTDSSEVASIGDRVLTGGELDELLPSGENTVPQRVANEVSTWLLTHAIEFELLDRGGTILETDWEEARKAVELGASSRTRRVEDVEVLTHRIAVSLAVGRWAEDQGADLETEIPNYLCSSHLLVETEEEAADALDRYEAGEAFAELAIELSTGPSGPNGGNLGCALEGTFVAEFEEAAFAAEAEDVAGPVETEFGWHLIEIHTVGPATLEFHPQADRQELGMIAHEVRQAEIGALIFDFEADARLHFGDSVSVEPSIGTIDLTTFAITPP